jgi:hypothetical protein
MQAQIILSEAEELGSLFFTRSEIELILNIKPDNIQNAILKGQLKSDAEVRKVVVQQAKSGSGEAQRLVQSWLSRIRFENSMNK